MEKIKKALERAKSDGSSANPVDVKDRKTLTSKADDSNLENLTYSQTRNVSLNPLHLEEHRIVAHNKNNKLSTAFDLLRTQVIQKMNENGWRTLAVTSPGPEAGKTVVSINLAMSIAQHTDKSAMLVDFDFRRPKVANYLGIELEKTINDYIENDVPISEILVNPELKRFVLLAAGQPIKNSSEILASKKIEKLIHEVKHRYKERIVIFDLPPILNTDDAITILPKIDCVLMVVANGMSTQHEIEESIRYLPDTNLLGVILNKSDENLKSYY